MGARLNVLLSFASSTFLVVEIHECFNAQSGRTVRMRAHRGIAKRESDRCS